jgi:hypothetical protein
MSEYVDTFRGICPSCNKRAVGHVFGLPEAGVYGWNCPRCDTSHEPLEVEETDDQTL